MLRARRLFIILSAVAGLTAATRGEIRADSPGPAPAEFQLAAPGSIMRFSNYVAVVGQSDNYFVSYTVNGKQYERTLVGYGRRETFSAGALAALSRIWPLMMGKTVRYQRQEPRGGGGSWHDVITVTGTEVVNVADTPLTTYVVQCTSKADYNNWESTTTVWFAPAIGWVVKWNTADSSSGPSGDHLVSYSLGPQPASK